MSEAVRRKNYSVILFDEIEKAYIDVLDILLQILEDGTLTDSKGKKVNFKNTIIIMTSNIGANILNKKYNEIGFKNNISNNEKITDEIKRDVMKEIDKTFKKEFLNRIDEIIIFNKLSEEVIRKIIEKYCGDLETRFKKAGYKVSIDNSIIDFILEKCLGNENGARDIKRKIKELIEEKIAEYIIENNIEKNNIINILCENNKILIN